MSFSNELKEILKKTSEEIRRDQIRELNGTALQYRHQLEDFITRLNYMIAYCQRNIDRKDIPEYSKARTKTLMYEYQQKKRKAERRLMQIYLEENGILDEYGLIYDERYD